MKAKNDLQWNDDILTEPIHCRRKPNRAERLNLLRIGIVTDEESALYSWEQHDTDHAVLFVMKNNRYHKHDIILRLKK